MSICLSVRVRVIGVACERVGGHRAVRDVGVLVVHRRPRGGRPATYSHGSVSSIDVVFR